VKKERERERKVKREEKRKNILMKASTS